MSPQKDSTECNNSLILWLIASLDNNIPFICLESENLIKIKKVKKSVKNASLQKN